MTLNEFFNKYNGRGIDFDNFYGFQCMDVYRQYVKEVLEAKQSSPVPGAKDVWTNYLADVFTKISNKPDNSPRPGDVVIWGDQLGPYGHIAICSQADTNNLTCFGQNFPLGSVCHFQKHTYFGVLGWLRPRGIETPAPTNPDQNKVELGEPWGTMEVQAIRSTLSDQKKLTAELEGQYRQEKIAKEAAMKENNDHLDALWEKLSPLGKEKNWPNVMGEIEGLLHKLDKEEPDELTGWISALISLFKRGVKK